MTQRALLVSTSNPYPVVKDGCQRLVHDYVDTMFPRHEVHFLHVDGDAWAPLALYADGRRVGGDVRPTDVLAHDFEFVVFVGFKVTDFTLRLSSAKPSFCYTDTFPHPNVPRAVFRGILSHRCSAGGNGEQILLVGGSYDDEVFYPDRRHEDIVLSVGRIDPSKNQLELVSRYREAIFERYGLPLYLAGGAQDVAYHREIEPFVDGVAVISSVVDADDPSGDANWHSARELAALCNRARLFVSGSPKESFSMAMIEAMACGTTCVVNGDYWGFHEPDLRPRVLGNITGPRGSIVDLVAHALRDDQRIDGSRWAARYSLRAMRDVVSQFVDERV
ncbi:MAG TPA: glycosyltransferase [Solirubrobacteraceae bacterium]|nr:glycosyltransferase [Solirubrobacteraceae bacterium]